ncbi:hypothetical protein JW964_03130 [candidate division KSB1 bacterium]|nr:hypothetical protein [candidate division KSB1 bacterium]
MAEKRYVDITKRKNNFNRIELIIYIVLAIIFVGTLIYNMIAKELFDWPGWFIIGIVILMMITLRNIFYIRQLSGSEFLKPEIYQRYRFYIAFALLGFILAFFFLPGTILLKILPTALLKPYNFIFYFTIGFSFSLIALIINLHLPIRFRELELASAEENEVRRWRQDLDEEWRKFREADELTLQNLNKPGNPPPVEVDTMTSIRERMDYIIKYLDHVKRNQYILVARYDITGVKLIKSRVALQVLLAISLFVAIRILFLV